MIGFSVIKHIKILDVIPKKHNSFTKRKLSPQKLHALGKQTLIRPGSDLCVLVLSPVKV